MVKSVGDGIVVELRRQRTRRGGRVRGRRKEGYVEEALLIFCMTVLIDMRTSHGGFSA